jgi:hypothetical protein
MSGLHSTVALSLPAIMASKAARTASMDTTTMSLPGARPARSRALMAPSAMSSLCANSTWMGWVRDCRIFSIAASPPSRAKSPMAEWMMVKFGC